MIALYVHVLRKRGLGQNRLLASATIALFVLCTAHCVLVLVAIATRTVFELEFFGGFAGGPGVDEALQLGALSLVANMVYVTAKCSVDVLPHQQILNGLQWDAFGCSRAQLGESSEPRWPAHITPNSLSVAESWDLAWNPEPISDGIVLAQLVGIAPTIIAVRVSLGQSVENINISFAVPRPRMHPPFHHEVIATAVDSVDDEVLYIRPESSKAEAVYNERKARVSGGRD
ncbi:hypothetical protein B0H14DRAFT_2654684 [Mycena olivaceomarginata]|nr:hypothetical protein B0H14DRAFT_2654684 [Mycena olivaceomarginata]